MVHLGECWIENNSPSNPIDVDLRSSVLNRISMMIVICSQKAILRRNGLKPVSYEDAHGYASLHWPLAAH